MVSHPGSEGVVGGKSGGYRSSLRPMTVRGQQEVDALVAQAETPHGTVAVPVGGQPAYQAVKRINYTRMQWTMRTCPGGSGRRIHRRGSHRKQSCIN